MATIEETGVKAVEFIKTTMHLDEARVVKAVHGDSGMEVEVEVFEESAFIKALGLHTRVRDRNVYLVNLDDQLNVQSYEREKAMA